MLNAVTAIPQRGVQANRRLFDVECIGAIYDLR